MSDAVLHQLTQSADLALKSQSVQEAVQHLSRAFSLFLEESNRIKNAHSNLQERLNAVNQELEIKSASLNRVVYYLSAFLKAVSEGVVFVDLEGTVTVLNDSAQSILKVKKEQLLFKKFWEVLPDDALGFSMRESLKFGISHKLLYVKTLEISTSFLYEGTKAQHGMLVIVKDIGEKQRLQLIANRNDQMKELGQMAATLAHEIRNPLGGIRGYASLLYRDLTENPHLQEMASLVIEGTKGLEKMVSGVLQYAKPLEIQLQTLDVGAFLKQVGKFVRIDPAFPPQVNLFLHIPDAPLLAPFDPQRLKAALLNLIFNALQAMPQGGQLSISLLKMESCYQIAVTDTGIGMDSEQLSQLFSLFYTTKKGGNGLGLVETKKIIQAHLGSIDVRSQPGKGSTFTLTLPLKR